MKSFCMTNVQEDICAKIKIGGKPVKDVINCANVMKNLSDPEQFYFDGFTGIITVDPDNAGQRFDKYGPGTMSTRNL